MTAELGGEVRCVTPRHQRLDIRCWACGTACTSSFDKGRWWYGMACDHDLSMAYDHAKWEAEHVAVS